MAAQYGCEQFLLPDTPFVRIRLRSSRLLQSSPQSLPGFPAFIDPHRRIGFTSCTLHAPHEVMCEEGRSVEPSAPLRITDSLLESFRIDARLEFVLVNADQSSHDRSPNAARRGWPRWSSMAIR